MPATEDGNGAKGGKCAVGAFCWLLTWTCAALFEEDVAADAEVDEGAAVGVERERAVGGWNIPAVVVAAVAVGMVAVVGPAGVTVGLGVVWTVV